MKRYFAQLKNNPESIVEVEEGSVPGILYRIETTFWKLTGPLEDILDEKGAVVEFGVKSTNNRMIKDFKMQMPLIYQVLTDPLEFTVHSPFTSDKIKKEFG